MDILNAKLHTLNNTLKRFFGIGVLFVGVLLSLFICVSIFGIMVGYFQTGQLFCDAQDEIYQAIKEKALTWIAYFSAPTADNRYIYFSTASNKTQTAIRLDHDHFFVVVEYAYPHTYLGLKGYVYKAQSLQQAYREYQFTQLEGDVYCYEYKF